MRSRQLAVQRTRALNCVDDPRQIRERLLYLVIHLVPSLVLLAAFAGTASAQTSQATIRGNVHDSTSAAVTDAKLVLMNVDTHVTSTTVTNSTGDYLFQNINPGNYTLEASRSGFSAQKLKPFVLVVNQTASLDFTLAVGNVTEVVQVDAVGEGVEASTSELGSTLETEQIEDLPLNGRNFTTLFTTVPGVSNLSVPGSQTLSYTTAIGSAIIPSFNGQSQRSNLFLVDGILDIETFGNAYAVQPIVDVIQDQKLQSHNDSAEFGGSSGGTINISTKPGTNTLHGSAWEYNKTSSLQALPYFTAPGTGQNGQKQNEFGGTLGGPVVIPRLYHGQNKSFFFGSYEGWRQSSPGTTILYVPTQAELGGDFRADAPIYDPASTTCDASTGTCTRQQFSYNGQLNVIPPSRLNQGDIYYAQNAVPGASSTPISGGNASSPSPSSQTYNEYDIRGDETIGQRDSAFFRIMGLKGPSSGGRAQLRSASTTNGYQYVGSYVHIFNASSTVHVQAGKTYLYRGYLANFVGVPSDFASKVGFPTGLSTGYFTLGNINPGFQVDNYFSDLGEDANPETTADGWSVKSDYTRVIGRHTLKVGAEFNKIGEGQDIEFGVVHFRSNETNSLNDTSATGVTGNALASFMIGTLNDATKRNLVESLGFGGVFGTYIQDQFQLTSKLTLNLGIRYDLALIPKYGTPSDNNQDVGNFDFNNGTYVVYKVPGPCASLGNAPCIPTPNGALPTNVVASSDGKVLENNNLNAQPRIGVAYRLTPTTAIRSGIGVAFDNYAALVQNVRGVSGNWPSVGQIQQGNFNVPTVANPFPNITPQTIPNLTSLPPATPFGLENWYVDPKMKDAYSFQWNFGVQRQLGPTTVASVTYVGSANKRLNVGGFYNVALTPGPGNPTLRAPYPYINPTFYSKSNGHGDYNALQAQLNRSFSHGLATTLSYTWGKSIDEGCSGFFGSEGCEVQQIYNIHADRSVSAFDVPQDFSATWNYELPIGRGKSVNVSNRALDMIAGGWQINGILQLISGNPYAVNISADIANIGNGGYERPNVVGSSVPSQRNVNDWLNPAGFAIPAQYTYGGMGRDSLRAQFYKDIDASISKEVAFESRYRIQFRAEAFNLPNEHVFSQPASTLGAVNFGQINSTSNAPRSVQLVGRFIF